MDYETGKFLEQILANQNEFKDALTEIYKKVSGIEEPTEEPVQEKK